MERQQEEGLGQGRVVRTRKRLGRAAVFSLGLVVGFLLLGYAALRVLELTPRGSSGRALSREREDGAARAWRGQTQLGGATVRLWLLPLHDEPVLERFRTQALRARYGLPPGEAWRLLVAVEGEAESGFELPPPRVRVDGQPLATLAELATKPAPEDPLFVLLAAPLRALAPGGSGALALWGELGDDARPEVEFTLADASLVALLERDDALLPPRSFARLEAPAARSAAEESLAEEVARLRQELDR
ncbi:MAG: hypothetical protein ABL998_23720, partial [Planctomycetota bacterium]